MIHEPECRIKDGQLCEIDTHGPWGEPIEDCPRCMRDCICEPLRATFRRGLERAAEIAEARWSDLRSCDKHGDCYVRAQGASLAAEDIRDALAAARGYGGQA